MENTKCTICGSTKMVIGIGGHFLCAVCVAAYDANRNDWQRLGGIPRYIAEMIGQSELARQALAAAQAEKTP